MTGQFDRTVRPDDVKASTSAQNRPGRASDPEHVGRDVATLTGDSSASRVIASRMTERQLQDNVVAMARTLGWLCYHTHDSRRSAPGYPDLTLVRDGRLVLVELKSQRGRLRAEQHVWLGELREVARERGIEVYLWRPMDWLDGTIEEVLA